MDRRTKRTTQNLHNCLLILLKQKPINKITVKELCQLADINRSTFYQYYDNPPAMLKQIQGEIMEQLKTYLLQKRDMKTADKLLEMMRYLYSKRQYCSIILGDLGEANILSPLLMVLYDNDVEWWKSRYPNMAQSQIYYLFSFAANGSKGIIGEWMKNGFQETPDHIAHLLETLCNRVFDVC